MLDFNLMQIPRAVVEYSFRSHPNYELRTDVVFKKRVIFIDRCSAEHSQLFRVVGPVYEKQPDIGVVE